jgi:hypothetical protein
VGREPARPSRCLQPEKVLSLPLDLRLNKDYTYKLEGLDKVGDRRAYAGAVPAARRIALALSAGTVWIDAESFVKLKVQAVQTQLSPPVGLQREIQYFTPAADLDGRTLSMFTRLVGRQIMLVAGRNLLVEREVKLLQLPRQHAGLRLRARRLAATNHVMYRDTERGLRYFVKKGEQRVVEDNPTTTAKALAFGVTIDPSYDFPLPIVGINYLDFEFMGKKQQLALLFGGVLALANVQHPKILGPRVDASLDLFAIAVPVNDQVYDAGGGDPRRAATRSSVLDGREPRLAVHRFPEADRQLPVPLRSLFGGQADDAGLRHPRQHRHQRLRPRLRVQAEGLRAGRQRVRLSARLVGLLGARARGFDPGPAVVPEVQREPLEGLLLRPAQDPSQRAYYGGGTWTASACTSSASSTRTASTASPPRACASASWPCCARAIRSTSSISTAWTSSSSRPWARTRPGTGAWRNVTGVGLGLNLRTPFGTMLRADLGKSFLPALYSGSGSFVAQIMILKPI